MEIKDDVTPLFRAALLEVGASKGLVASGDGQSILMPYPVWRTRDPARYWEAGHYSMKTRADITGAAARKLLEKRHGTALEQIDMFEQYRDRLLQQAAWENCHDLRRFIVEDGEFAHGSYLVRDR